MLRDNNKGYYYEDQFMYFNFNGIHSSQYNLFMINKGDNIKIITDTKSKTEFLSPSYQNFTYFLGTTDTQKEFKYNCAAEDLTFAQCGELFQWLKQGTLGFLILDDNPDWGYDVVLENVSDAITTPTRTDRYIVEFDISFKTVGTYLASSIYPSSSDRIEEISSNQITDTDYTYRDRTILNEYGIPEIDCVEIEKITTNKLYTINLPSVCNEYSYVDFYFEGKNLNNLYLKINKKELNNFDTYVFYSIKTEGTDINNIEFKSKLGFLMVNNTQLAETLSGEVIGEQTKGLLSFDNKKPIKINPDTMDGTKLVLENTDADNYSILTNSFICCVKRVESQPYSSNPFLEEGNKEYRYSYQSKIWYDKDLTIDQERKYIDLNELQPEWETYSWYIGTYNQIQIEVSSDFVPALTIYKHNNI